MLALIALRRLGGAPRGPRAATLCAISGALDATPPRSRHPDALLLSPPAESSQRGLVGGILGWNAPRARGEVETFPSASGRLSLQSRRHYRTNKRSSKYEPDEEQHLVDDAILDSGFSEVRVVSSDGTHEVLSVKRALAKSKRGELNLVVVDQNARPPVCRMMDYSYFKFNQTKREREKKRPENKPKKRKEVVLGTKISSGHLEMKYDTIVRFLGKRHPVKVTAVDARGDDLKEAFLQEFKAKMEDEGYTIPQPVRVDQARKASIIVQPKKS